MPAITEQLLGLLVLLTSWIWVESILSAHNNITIEMIYLSVIFSDKTLSVTTHDNYYAMHDRQGLLSITDHVLCCVVVIKIVGIITGRQ